MTSMVAGGFAKLGINVLGNLQCLKARRFVEYPTVERATLVVFFLTTHTHVGSLVLAPLPCTAALRSIVLHLLYYTVLEV